MVAMKDTTSHHDFPDSDPNAVTIEQANERIAKQLPTFTQTEQVPVLDSLGRILSDDVYSAMPSPPFRASAMDGFAFRLSDKGMERTVIGESYAGHPGPNSLAPGHCVRITTGAKVPDDADTVVQQENTELHDGVVKIVQLPKTMGHHVRDKGSDCQQGDLIAAGGTTINASLLGLLSALGVTKVNVYQRLRITVISTGDELKLPGEPLEDGQIFDANTPLLAALLSNPSFNIRIDKAMQDSFESVSVALSNAIHDSDIVITSGGVSVGERDHLRTVVDSMGGVALWKVAMKPGRPLSFGVLKGTTPWFGLPGNPVSAALTTLLFVLPALKQCQGQIADPIPVLKASCTDVLKKLPGRVEFQRGVLSNDGQGNLSVSTTGLQDSHVLSSMTRSNCFIRLPLSSDGALPGDVVDIIPYQFFRANLL